MGEQRSPYGQRDQPQDDDGRPDGHLVLAQPPPGELPLAAALDRRWRAGRGLGLELELGNAHDASLAAAVLVAVRVSWGWTGEGRGFWWVGGSPVLFARMGSVCWQVSWALGQRGWKRQPVGGLMGEGT